MNRPSRSIEPRTIPEAECYVMPRRLCDDMTLVDRLRDRHRWQRLNPMDGTCWRCQLPWSCVTPKAVMTSENSGAFAICVPCWNELGTPEARLPFYLMIPYDFQAQTGDIDIEQMSKDIELAVHELSSIDRGEQAITVPVTFEGRR